MGRLMIGPAGWRRPFRGLVCAVGGLTFAACSSPTAPNAFVAITGTSFLTSVGQTSQLRATDGTGTDVTMKVTWQSSNTAVATVTPAALVTATGLGTAFIEAVYLGQQSTLAISVGQSGTTTITACQSISAPGAYIVANDISTGTGTTACLTLGSVSAVSLNCGGHRIGNLTLTSLTNVTVTNCNVQNVTGGGLTDVSVTGSTLGTWSTQTSTVRLSLTQNHFAGGVVMRDASFLNFANNVLAVGTSPGAFLGVELVGGNHNQVLNNTIDGGYDGSTVAVGLDDGVALFNETNDTIQGNTISNCFDTAIESVDVLANTTIAGNTVSNLGVAGIGAFFCTNWTGNVVQGNNVSVSPQLLNVEYRAGLQCDSPMASAAFSNNQLVGNRFRSPASGLDAYGTIPRMSIVFDDPTVVSGNLIQSNDFGAEIGPVLAPLAGFINGGGNICVALNPAVSGANFSCGSGSSPSRSGLTRPRSPRR